MLSDGTSRKLDYDISWKEHHLQPEKALKLGILSAIVTALDVGQGMVLVKVRWLKRRLKLHDLGETDRRLTIGTRLGYCRKNSSVSGCCPEDTGRIFVLCAPSRRNPVELACTRRGCPAIGE